MNFSNPAAAAVTLAFAAIDAKKNRQCIPWQQYAPGCPHIFDGRNYDKWSYWAVIDESRPPVKCWPNAGVLHRIDNSKGDVWPQQNVLCWMEVCDYSLQMYRDRVNRPLSERIRD